VTFDRLLIAAHGVFVNVPALVSIVLTQEAARFVSDIAKDNPDVVVPIEMMVEPADG
jgi:hypothetical protein